MANVRVGTAIDDVMSVIGLDAYMLLEELGLLFCAGFSSAMYLNIGMTVLQPGDLVLVDVRADHIAAELGEAGARHESHVSRSDYTDIHDCVPSCSRLHTSGSPIDGWRATRMNRRPLITRSVPEAT